jgi:hypothetical protein
MRVEELERNLRAERPELDPQFAAKLDEWAAAGFPRGGELGSGISLADRVRNRWDRLRARPPRRYLLPVGAAATLFVVIGIGVSQLGGDDQGAGEDAASVQPYSSPPAGGSDAAAAEAVPERAAKALALGDSGSAGVARGAENRLEDKSARLSLGAEEGEVQEVANGVVEVTDRYDGFVLNSQVTSDQAGARANFELEIPAEKLDPALADFSELGDVISRTEAAEDITARYVRASRQLADVEDQIAKLRIERIEADTFEQRRIIQARINALEASARALEAEVNGVERKARFASVAVDVTSNGPPVDDGGWDLGDAVDDAGDVLTTLAGIALIALAILVPLAVVGVLTWLAIGSIRRRRRERALDS